MSRDLRGALSVIVLLIGTLPALAEEPATTLPSTVYDRYTADPAESYVVEMSDAQASDDAAASSYEPQRVAQAPVCRAYYPAVIGSERSSTGTICEQSDGSLRMVNVPSGDLRTDERLVGYCREYQQVIDGDSEARTAHGTVCWQAEGSWRVVRPATLTFADAPREIFESTYAAREPERDYESFAPRASRPATIEEYRAPETYYEPRRRMPMHEEPLRSARLYPVPSYAPNYRSVNRAPSFTERMHRLFDWRSNTRSRDYRRYDRRDND